jgi:hypothetical protein
MTDAELLETIDRIACAKLEDGKRARNDILEKALATLAREYTTRRQAQVDDALRFLATRRPAVERAS